MKSLVIAFLLSLISISALGSTPIPEKEWNRATHVWAARSCVGESGFRQYEDCGAILWVYAKRYHQMKEAGNKKSFLAVLKSYSAAIKLRDSHNHKWLFSLDHDIVKKPKFWPKLRWPKYREMWYATLTFVEKWFLGEVIDPFPKADEYGCYYDSPNARKRGWKKIGTKTNIFWCSGRAWDCK